MANSKVTSVKLNTFKKKPDTLVDLRMARKMEKEPTTMEMAECGKDSGKIIGKMGMGSLEIKRVLKFKDFGLMGSRVRAECRKDETLLHESFNSKLIFSIIFYTVFSS